MMRFGMAIAMLAVAVSAHAQERTAGQSHDAQVNWEVLTTRLDALDTQNKALASTLTKMQACNSSKKVYAPSDPTKDANGCVSIAPVTVQTGTVGNGGAWSTQTVHVTFPKAFTTTPKVVLAVQGYYYRGSCSVNEVNFAPSASNVSTSGFNVTFPAYADGCNRIQLNGVTWTATSQ